MVDDRALPAVRVMLVDDHPVLAHGLARLLEVESDIEVVAIVERAEDVLPAYVRSRPDVVLLDYDLSTGNGIEVARQLADHDAGAKVVMLTASASQSVLRGAIEVGCVGFLTKTSQTSETIGAIRAAHRGESVISPQMLARLLPVIGGTEPSTGAVLSVREREILELIAQGNSNAVVAQRLYVSVHTVRHHVQKILTKLGAHSKLEAVTIAMRQGILPPPS